MADTIAVAIVTEALALPCRTRTPPPVPLAERMRCASSAPPLGHAQIQDHAQRLMCRDEESLVGALS